MAWVPGVPKSFRQKSTKNIKLFGKPCDDASKFQNEQDISNMAKKEWKYFVQYLRQIESENEQ